jgi:hypothetical protein
MPKYNVLRDTFISHESRLVKAGEVVDITWPEGAEPKKLGDNLELVKDEKPEKGAKS